MNKTVSINIGGLFFHIDENAYQRLTVYLNAIKSSLDADSREEVMNDIEGRIAEILSSRMQIDKQVVNNLDIDNIIEIMGKPEDYIIEDVDTNTKSKNNFDIDSLFAKKMYRDEDEGKIGGVCAGLSHYYGIDVTWVRILFIIAFLISSGFAALFYIILWVILPKAVTTSEKLHMRGEPINISNIEKKVKEGFDKVSNGISEMGNSISSNPNLSVNNLERFFKKLFRGIGAFVGALLIIATTLGIGTLFLLSSSILFNLTEISTALNVSNLPFEGFNTSLFAILLFISSSIPLLFLLFLGIKLISPNTKFIGRYTLLTLLSIWIISLFGWIYFGISVASFTNEKGNLIVKSEILTPVNDTLKVNVLSNTQLQPDYNSYTSGKFIRDESGLKVFYSNKVEVEFRESENNTAYIQVEKIAYDKNFDVATTIANTIAYNVKFEDNILKIDNYFTANSAYKNKKLKVVVHVYLPKDTKISFNELARDYVDYLHETENKIYKISNYNTLECTNCTEDDTRSESVKIVEIVNDSVSNINININSKEINELKKEIIREFKNN